MHRELPEVLHGKTVQLKYINTAQDFASSIRMITENSMRIVTLRDIPHIL